jgi:hypothetical protein
MPYYLDEGGLLQILEALFYTVSIEDMKSANVEKRLMSSINM